MSYSVSSGEDVRGGIYKPIKQDVTYPQRFLFKNNYMFFCGPGDPEGFLFLGSKGASGARNNGAQQAILDSITANGSNVIYVQAVRSVGDGTADQTPWPDNDPANGLSRPIMQQWHNWFQQCLDRGIIVLFFIWDDHDGNSRVFPGTGSIPIPAGEDQFLQDITNEFKIYSNIIWICGEENEEGFNFLRSEAQADSIRAASDDVLIGCHYHSDVTFPHGSDENIRFYPMQINNPDHFTNITNLYTALIDHWNDAVTDGYPYAVVEIGDPPAPRGTDARKHDWVCFMAGACGVARLEMDPVAHTTELEDCQRLITFCEDSTWYQMAPNDSDIVAGADHLLSGGDDHIAWVETYAASFQIGSMAAGTYTVMWQSCDADVRDTQTGQVLSAGTNTFTKPGGISNECALYLQRTA